MTCERRPFFQDPAVAGQVAAALRAIEAAGMARSMAWVLMPDHLHWLLQPEGAHTTSAILAELRRATNDLAAHGDNGLWAESFSAEPLPEQADIREVSREIVANPLRWGLVESLGDYPHWDAIWI
jgi:REP element-mobilizing transposase RayT